GTLVHPQVVMTAAHCVIPERPIVGLGFGEHGQTTGVPARVVEPIDCVGNPEYYAGSGADVAYCLLSEAVLDVPIVPLLAGCEVEQLTPGREVYIIGFGADFGSYDPGTDTVTATGVGPKRWTTQTVDFVDDFAEEINLLGSNGSQSACFGDSGGPGMVQLDDGSWRVFGTGGHLYDPGGLPPPMIPDNICGVGAAYGFAPFAIEWLEQETALDLTPCWNGDEWTPSPDCADFALAPEVGAGTWATGCSDGPIGGGDPPECADYMPPPGGSSSTGDTGDTGDTTGEPESSTGVDSTGSPPPTSDGPMPPDPLPGDTGTGGATDTDTAAADGGSGDEGCGCRADRSAPARGTAAPWLLLAVVALRRRHGRRHGGRPVGA
ncbi:MAG: trypsin-like serine protease, partial [Myxococcales bacterium]|nr:trypsin-like serine protease [Myxococcales bacterium]